MLTSARLPVRVLGVLVRRAQCVVNSARITLLTRLARLSLCWETPGNQCPCAFHQPHTNTTTLLCTTFCTATHGDRHCWCGRTPIPRNAPVQYTRVPTPHKPNTSRLPLQRAPHPPHGSASLNPSPLPLPVQPSNTRAAWPHPPPLPPAPSQGGHTRRALLCWRPAVLVHSWLVGRALLCSAVFSA